MVMCKRKHPGIWKGGAYLVLLVWLGNALGTVMASNGDAGPAVSPGYTLDLVNRTAVQTVDQGITAPQAKKFVQIEVTDVFNPQRIPLTFNVHYQATHGEKSLLGTFSLFPPDNPGTFIVATRGKLQSGGLIIVSLEPLEQVDEAAEIRVQLKRISFIGD
jgi:hypothetical protein